MAKTEFIDNTDKIKQALRLGAARAVQRMADRIVEEALDNVPIDTGDLARSIQSDPVERKGDRISATFGAYEPHAAPVEFGSATRGEPFAPRSPLVSSDWPTIPPGKKTWNEYEIRPKNAPYLVFNVHDAQTGKKKVIKTKKMMHPGVRPRPYMRPAIDHVRFREARDIMQEEFMKALDSAVGRSPPPEEWAEVEEVTDSDDSED